MVKVQGPANCVYQYFQIPQKCKESTPIQRYNVELNGQQFGDTNYNLPRRFSKKKRSRLIREEDDYESNKFDDTHCPNLYELKLPAVEI